MICVRTTTFTISIHNERSGYFKGGRGLRQGDPISPYIFTLVMEVFTLILQSQFSKDAKLKYHWGCKDLKISHLCFADDLLVLYHGDLNFVKVVKRALDLFSSISGLNQNFGKNCKGLIDKVKIKVNDWKNKLLSYVGRLQLIASILSSMQVYWASVFILPKYVVKDINKLLKGFL
ncbi:RNA-directed DNA polymerase, eukaryota, reverse transcriptase zinc-binding domain protein [Tanacetum coccineum]